MLKKNLNAKQKKQQQIIKLNQEEKSKHKSLLQWKSAW